MSLIFNNSGIVIEKKLASDYQLSCNQTKLSWNKNSILDLHGSTIMSFKPKTEMFWDMKLFLKKKLSIGVCTVGSDNYSVYLQGIKKQKIFYQEEHILSKYKSFISLEKNFRIEKIEHLSLLLILAVYNDRRE